MGEVRITSADSFTVLSSLLAHLVVELDAAGVIDGETYADQIASAFPEPSAAGAAQMIADTIRKGVNAKASSPAPLLRLVTTTDEDS